MPSKTCSARWRGQAWRVCPTRSSKRTANKFHTYGETHSDGPSGGRDYTDRIHHERHCCAVDKAEAQEEDGRFSQAESGHRGEAACSAEDETHSSRGGLTRGRGAAYLAIARSAAAGCACVPHLQRRDRHDRGSGINWGEQCVSAPSQLFLQPADERLCVRLNVDDADIQDVKIMQSG